MKGKKFLAFALATAMLAGGALSVSAAGVSDVFNGNYYAGKYADLKANVGTDEAALLNHAVTNGAKEGRVISPILDVAAYRKAYADLDAAFGDDWNAYVDHYLTYGIKEKRTAGVLFDLVDYANKNADVKAAYGDDYAAIAKHYVTFGINEGRPGGAIVKEAPKAAASAPSNNTPAQKPEEPAKPQEPVYPQGDPTLAQHKHAHEDYDWSVFFNSYKLNNGSLAERPDWFNGTLKEPTCTEDGYVEWTCNEPIYKNILNAKGEIVRTTVTGNCDKVMHVVWPKSHKIREGQGNAFLLAPTCQSEGTAIYTCGRCGLPITETLPKVSHIYRQTIVEPTGCGHDFSHPERLVGYYKYDCIYCGESFTKFRDEKWKVNQTLDPVTGVVRTEWEHDAERQPEHQVATHDNVITKATCLTAGLASGYCSKCNEVDTVTVAPLGHNAIGDPGTVVKTIYIDSYTTTDQMAGLADDQRCHKKVDVTVCGRDGCDVIIDVGMPQDEVCTTSDVTKDKPLKDKVCDSCMHGMLRQYKDQMYDVRVGEYLHNVVGQ